VRQVSEADRRPARPGGTPRAVLCGGASRRSIRRHGGPLLAREPTAASCRGSNACSREACWLSGRLWAAGWLRDCAAAASGLAVRMPANSPRWRLGRPRTGDVLTGKWLWIGKVGRFHACAASPHGTPGLTPHEDRAWNRAPLTGGCAPCAVPRAVLPRGRATAHARCRARRARSQQRGQPGPGTRPGERCGAPATDQSQPYHAV